MKALRWLLHTIWRRFRPTIPRTEADWRAFWRDVDRQVDARIARENDALLRRLILGDEMPRWAKWLCNAWIVVCVGIWLICGVLVLMGRLNPLGYGLVFVVLYTVNLYIGRRTNNGADFN